MNQLESVPQDMSNKITGCTTILIVGAAGFVGGHLLRHLAEDSTLCVCATKLPFETMDTTGYPQIRIYDLDIISPDSTRLLLEEIHPDLIIQLAAQSSVGLSFQKPELTMNINIIGSLHVMEAVRSACPDCKVLMVGSSEQYGPVPQELQPVKETTQLDPVSPYAISKTAAESLASLYVRSYDLKFIMVRAFNHIGPGQLPLFVVSDFARQIAMIEKNQIKPVISVGNLSARRDFTDVRDIVRGYRMLTISGRPGQVYNIGSGKSVEIQYILDTLLSYAKVPIQVLIDPAKFRPVDVPEIRADITKIETDTKWCPEIPLETSLLDSLNYWRTHV